MVTARHLLCEHVDSDIILERLQADYHLENQESQLVLTAACALVEYETAVSAP